MSDSFRGADPEFHTTTTQFCDWLATNALSVGVSAADVLVIQAKKADWDIKYPDHVGAQATAATAASEKDTSRAELEAVLRPAAKKVTVPAQRVAAGLNEYAEARARVPVPTSRPVLAANTSQRLCHTFRWHDENTPNSRKKPDGVRSIEFRCYIGDTPPADPADFDYCANDTAEPYMIEYDAVDAGKKAWVVGRWENSRGEKGPWSETVMATIGA